MSDTSGAHTAGSVRVRSRVGFLPRPLALVRELFLQPVQARRRAGSPHRYQPWDRAALPQLLQARCRVETQAQPQAFRLHLHRHSTPAWYVGWRLNHPLTPYITLSVIIRLISVLPPHNLRPPFQAPTFAPTGDPTLIPSRRPTLLPTVLPSRRPSSLPSILPSTTPTLAPTPYPSKPSSQDHEPAMNLTTRGTHQRYSHPRRLGACHLLCDPAPSSNLAVDCVMSSWSYYTNCSTSCGAGTQTRTRSIITAAFNGGTACSSDLSESKSCSYGPCTDQLSIRKAERALVPRMRYSN